MKIQPYVEKLNVSKEFKDFKSKHPDSFMVAGFFILDLEMKQNLHQIDFYIPSKKKFAAFTLDKDVEFQILDSMTEKVPEELDIDTKIDLDALEGILEDEMKNRNISEDIKKIIAVVQNIDGKKVWNLNCVLSGMEVLKAHVEDSSKTVLKMERISVMELMKKMPGQGGQGGAQGLQMTNPKGKPSPQDIKEEIKKLDNLEEQIEKEKEALKKQAEKK